MSDFAAEQLVPFLRSESLFSPLDDESLRRLAEGMELRRFSIGETVFSEGDVGHDAWLVFSGRVRVLKRSESGQHVTLATQSVGELFGEQAILNDVPRSATVRAAEDSVLFRIERSEFERIVAEVPQVLRYFEEFMQERAVRDFLRTATVLETLKSNDVTRLLDRLERREFPAGATLIREGEQADALFIIRSGRVRVVQLVNGQEQLLRTLGEGESFGEWALIEDRTRTATVIAEIPTRCFTLCRDDFESLFQSSPRLRDRFARRLAMYQTTGPSASVDEPQSSVAPTNAQREDRPRQKKQLTLQPLTFDANTAVPADQSSDPAPGSLADVTNQKPKPGWFGRWPWVPQDNQSDCGPASLAMVARCYGAYLSINKLRDMANVGREGASLFSLAAAAEEVGFRVQGVETDMDHLVAATLPAIAHWQGFHYMVVFEVADDRVTIGDPARGVLKIPRAEFESGWTGRLLLLTPARTLTTHETPPSTHFRLRRLLGVYQQRSLNGREPEDGATRSSVSEKPVGQVSLFLVGFHAFLLSSLFAIASSNDLSLWTIVRPLLICGAVYLASEWSVARGIRRFRQHIMGKVTFALQHAPASYFYTRSTTQARNRSTDTHAVARLVISTLRTEYGTLAIIAAIAMIFWFVPATGMVAVAWLASSVVFVAIATVFIGRETRRQHSRQTHAACLIQEFAGDDSGTRGSQASMRQTLMTATDHVAAPAERVANLVAAYQTLLVVWSLLAGMTIWVGNRLTIESSQMIAVQALLAAAATPLIRFVGQIEERAHARLALNRIEELLEAASSTPRPVVSPTTIKGHLELDNVSFQYNSAEEPVLTAINLQIPAGQTIAIVGRDGSGRSALARLIQGLYMPTSGQIRVDGHDLSEFDPTSWRECLGVSTRETQLMTGTVRQNISASDPTAPTEAVQEVARLAGADGFISRLPQGLDTMVGTLGVELSGSQRQRIGIARALFNQPPILIFDEATDELDDEQENRLWNDLHAVLAERTVILIPHRLKAAALADRVVVLDGGVIAEQGTHAELLEAGGLYSFLWSQSQA